MTEETQEKFDNILIPTGPNSMVELSNQDLLTFIQNQITQDNSIRYQGLQNDTMQTTNNPKIVTNKNETQFFPPQETPSTTQEQMLHSFDHNYNTHELAIPKEHYLFELQSPFQVTNPNHKRFTNKTTSIMIKVTHSWKKATRQRQSTIIAVLTHRQNSSNYTKTRIGKTKQIEK